MKNALKLLGLVGVWVLSSCTSLPYPYFDASMNDHNRAPASLGVPHTDSEKNGLLQRIAQQSEADYLFLKSEILSSEGQSDQSIATLQSALKVDPNSVVFMQKLGVEYYKQGKITDAVYWVQKALTEEPKKKELLLLYGSMLIAKKDFAKAEETYIKMTKLYPKDVEAYLYLGAVASEQNQHKKAYTYFTKVIKSGTYEPEHLPYYYRARAIMDAKDKKLYSQAQTDLKKCFELKPEFLEAVQVYANILEKSQGRAAVFKFYIQYQKDYGPISRLAEVLSQYYIEKDDYDNAFEQLEILEANTDDTIQVKLKMALILIDKKMYDKAVVKLEELNAMVPESDKVKYYLAAVYEELKQNDKAIKVYNSIPVVSHHYDDARIRSALLLKSNEQRDEAIKTVEIALEHKKNNLQLYLMLAQLWEEKEDFHKAINVLVKADKEFPKNSQLHYFIGTLFDKLNDKQKMMSYMRLAVDYDEQNYQAMNYAAYSLSEMNLNLDEAEKLALKAHEIQKNDPYIIDTLGWVYYKKGQFQLALKYLELAHKISPEVGLIAEHLGDVYLKLNKESKARSAYLRARQDEKDTERIKALDGKITSIEQARQRSPASVESLYP